MSNLSLLYSLILAVILISWLRYILFISHLALDAITPNHTNCFDNMVNERFVIKLLANVSVLTATTHAVLSVRRFST